MTGTRGLEPFELDKSFAFDLLAHQQGRCAYSGAVLNMFPQSHWRGSLERVNPSHGYVCSNANYLDRFGVSDSYTVVMAQSSVLASIAETWFFCVQAVQ